MDVVKKSQTDEENNHYHFFLFELMMNLQEKSKMSGSLMAKVSRSLKVNCVASSLLDMKRFINYALLEPSLSSHDKYSYKIYGYIRK